MEIVGEGYPKCRVKTEHAIVIYIIIKYIMCKTEQIHTNNMIAHGFIVIA